MNERKKAVFNWSGGKDSALALQKIFEDNEFDVVSLLTTINEETLTSSIHSIRVELLTRQAESIGIPLYTILIMLVLFILAFYVLKYTHMVANLCECGFMDHPVDTPLILTDKYASQLAQGFVNAIVKVGGLKKKPAPKPGKPGKYMVQVGEFNTLAEANAVANLLKSAAVIAVE